MLYGVHGIGKSTFGAMAPRPVFIQTEDGLDSIDCARFPPADAFDSVMAAIMELYTELHEYQTIVVDSLDWLERLIWEEVVRRKPRTDKGREVSSIEDYGFAKGYTYALDLWKEVLDGLGALRNERAMMVILIAHAKIERFENPETDAYDRYSPTSQQACFGPGAGVVRRGPVCNLQGPHPADGRRVR